MVLKIWQHYKIWGTITPLQILVGLVPRHPVIYAHACNNLLGAQKKTGSSIDVC